MAEDDNELFMRAMQGVIPLNKSDSNYFKPRKRPVVKQAKTISQRFSDNMFYSSVTSEQTLFWQDPSVPAKTIKQLKQGRLRIEASLDLHNFTVEQARFELLEFLTKCHQANKRCLLVIHGKGYNSENNIPIIKTRVNSWLQQLDFILAFVSATNQHGGTGAVYIYLKRNR